MKKNRICAVAASFMIGVAAVSGNALHVYASEIVTDASIQPPPAQQLGTMVKLDGNIYYVYQDGTIAKDWVMIDGDWYFFRPADGTMAIDTVINCHKFGVDGKFVEMVEPEPEPPVKNPELKDKVDSILASIITDGMSEDQKIRACYNYVMDNTVYERTYEKPAGDWTGGWALQLLTSKKGNCYRYAAAFAYLVTGLGYEAKVSTGQIAASRGGVTPHGWAEVKVDNVWYIYDPDIEDGNRKYDCYKKTYANYPIKPLNRENEWPVSFY